MLQGCCKRGKSQRHTAEGHRQRAERTLRSPELPSFPKPPPTPNSARGLRMIRSLNAHGIVQRYAHSFVTPVAWMLTRIPW